MIIRLSALKKQKMENQRRFINMFENKPCPFCGSNELSYRTSTEDREGIPTNIFCQDCGANGPWAYISEKEINLEPDELPVTPLKLWNKRK